MKPREFFDQMAQAKELPVVATLSPGPFSVQVTEADKRAAELLDDMREKWDGLTLQELLDLLDAARWWIIFWGAQKKQEESEASNEQ